MSERSFLCVAGITAFLSALTTIGVHYISFPAQTFDERASLALNGTYLAHRWMIILHCLFVVWSMCGVGMILWQRNKGLAALGFLFFSVFSIAEISRMFSVLAYLNPLRTRYLESSDPVIREALAVQIETFTQASIVFFVVFIFAFALGNLFYGIGLFNRDRYNRLLAAGLLLNALTTFCALFNHFLPDAFLSEIVEWSGKIYQPLIRIGTGLWLWMQWKRI